MGKGSKRRPATVADQVIESNWERIFGKNNGRQTDKVQPSNTKKGE
jgi:hypothetical protein